MKSNPSHEKRIQIYNLGFVMLMSRGTQESSSFEDSLYKKALLIENFNRLRMKLGDRVFNNVLIGKNGWMEYIGDQNLDDYQHALRFNRKTLRSISRNIQSCYQYAQEQGITFLIVVAPNK